LRAAASRVLVSAVIGNLLIAVPIVGCYSGIAA